MVTRDGVGHIMGHSEFETASRMRWPAGNLHPANRMSTVSRYHRPGSSGRGSAGESRWAPFSPPPETSVDVPSGATSHRRQNQCASGASDEATSFARGMPTTTSSSGSGAVS